jgi:hypothetical protein
MITLNEKMKQFINCRYVWREYGFHDLSLFTQACLESGNFLSVIGQNNCFGRKVPQKSVWHGKIIERPTKEQELVIGSETKDQALVRLRYKYSGKRDVQILERSSNGRVWTIHVFDWFIDLPTMEQMILNQCEFIKNNFGDAFFKRNDPAMFFFKLQDNIPDSPTDSDLVYATDKNYVPSLIARKKEIESSPSIIKLLFAD